jgi:predicted ATPase/DNA-binding CsgD family transcriptional regulator
VIAPYSSSHLTAFVGRAKERDEIVGLINEPECRLLSLVGPGGIGKTRLALEVTKILSAHTPTLRPHFVPLQAVSSPEYIVSAIADVLIFAFAADIDPTQQLLDFLRQQSFLLILDNFEHLLDGVDLVHHILVVSPQSKILTTSRATLNLQEEWLYPIHGMGYPEATPAEPLENYEAVRLFSKCARRTRPDFSLDAEQEAVIRICRMVEGMPLALEMTATWLKRLPCAEIVRELEYGLDILESPLRNVEARHRSIRAVFEHSWNLLKDVEREIFKKLAVFRGGFTREAAQVIAGASLWDLSSLVEKSLLRVNAVGRYDLHELVRQYALEQLEMSGGIDTIQDNHSRYYLDCVAAREEDVKGRRQAAALQELGADFENVRVAWQRALERKNDAAINAALSGLTLFCDMTSRHWHLEEILNQTEVVFGAEFGEQQGLLWARITAHALWMSFMGASGQNDAAPPSVERCLEIAAQFQDDEVALWGWCVRGMIYFWRYEFEKAVTAFQESLRCAQQREDPFCIADRLTWIGSSYRELSQYSQAIDYLQRSAQMQNEIGNKHGGGFTLSQLALTLFAINRNVEAEHHIKEALSLHQEIGCLKGITWYTAVQSNMALNVGELQQAEHLAQTVWKMATDFNYLDGKYHALLTLGYIAVLKGDYLKSQAAFERMVSLKRGIPPSLTPMSIAAFGLGDIERCRGYLGEIINRVLSTTSPRGTLFFGVAALLLAQEGRKERAVELLALASLHPANFAGLVEQWPLITRLCADLEAELGTEAFQVAWEVGKSLDLHATARALLSELNIPAAPELPKSPPRLPDALSEREREILNLIAAGLSNREIADKLCLAVSTVKWYINEMYSKLGVATRTQAFARARELKLLS